MQRCEHDQNIDQSPSSLGVLFSAGFNARIGQYQPAAKQTDAKQTVDADQGACR